MSIRILDFFSFLRLYKNVFNFALLQAMYIGNEAKKTSSVGDIVNLMSVDAQRVQEFCIKVAFCHTTPFLIIISMVFIYSKMGPSVLVGE